MNDTAVAVQRRFEQMLMRKSPEERLRMGCSMFTAARTIAEISIRANSPQILSSEMKRKLFLRFYGAEFSDSQIQSILCALI